MPWKPFPPTNSCNWLMNPSQPALNRKITNSRNQFQTKT
jgi:hypothetical protein